MIWPVIVATSAIAAATLAVRASLLKAENASYADAPAQVRWGVFILASVMAVHALALAVQGLAGQAVCSLPEAILSGGICAYSVVMLANLLSHGHKA